MKVKRRVFWVDEDEQIHRLPAARYYRIFCRTQAMYLFAGKIIRFCDVDIEFQDDQPAKVIRMDFSQYQFDAEGLIKQEQKDAQLRDACKMLEVFGQSDWEELYSLKYNASHRWKPTKALFEGLCAAAIQT